MPKTSGSNPLTRPRTTRKTYLSGTFINLLSQLVEMIIFTTLIFDMQIIYM